MSTDDPPTLSEADRAILFMIEAGFDIAPYQMDIIHRCFEVADEPPTQRCVVCEPVGGQYPSRDVVRTFKASDEEATWWVNELSCGHHMAPRGSGHD